MERDPTYEIHGRRKSIIDVCLTNDVSLIHKFTILPNILGVNPQTSHRVLKLVIPQDLMIGKDTDIDVSDPKHTRGIAKLQKFRFCSYESLQKVKVWVSERFSELAHIRKGKKKFYNYSVLQRVYFNAKSKLIGFAKKKNCRRKKVLSKKAQRLQ